MPEFIYVQCRACKNIVRYGRYAPSFICPICGAQDFNPKTVDKGSYIEWRSKGFDIIELQRRLWRPRVI